MREKAASPGPSTGRSMPCPQAAQEQQVKKEEWDISSARLTENLQMSQVNRSK